MVRGWVKRWGAAWITLVLTLLSALLSAAATVAAHLWYGAESMEFGIVLAVLIPLFIAPALSYAFIRLLEKLDKAEVECSVLIAELQQALDSVNRLEGLLPVCAACKRIRDDKGYWNQMEEYIRARTKVEFTHGICPQCRNELYGNMEEESS